MSLRPSKHRGVVRDRLDEIKSIQTLLADVYKNALIEAIDHE